MHDLVKLEQDFRSNHFTCPKYIVNFIKAREIVLKLKIGQVEKSYDS